MEDLTKFKLNRRRWTVQLALTTGLALLFLAAWLWGLQDLTPVRADPGTLYVDGAIGSNDSDCSNPAAPCATIGYALTQAGNGDEIRVAEGTYTETLDIAITVTLKGGYTMSGTLWLPSTGETIVDGNGADEPVIAIYPRSLVTIEGFIVQGANHVSDGGGGIGVDRATAVVSDTVVRNNSGSGGGGIHVEKWEGYPGSLTLINSSLLSNTSTEEGGGLKSAGWPTVTLDSVVVQDNTAQSGGGGLSVGRVTITNSQIVSNTAGGSGGGVWANVAYIYNSEINGNEVAGEGTVFGGGISVPGRLDIWDSTVSGNRLVGDESIGGGISAEGAKATIVNTIVSNNSAQIRGGVTVYQTILTMTNSLLIGNTGDGLGGRYITGTIVNVTSADNTGSGLNVGGAVTITNSIIWGNSEPNYVCTGGCTLTYSDVEDEGITGPGNIFADPLFVDAATGDYCLRVGSPCINAGTSVGAPAADIVGTPRDTAPDMGAYEWTGFRIFLPLTLRNFGL